MATASPPGRGPWTYRDLCERTPEDHARREIIDGWLYLDGEPVADPSVATAAESANPRHQGVVVELVYRLRRFQEERPGQVLVSPMDCAFGDDVLQPDVLWLDTREPVERPVAVTPALVVEVSSPSTRRHDLVRKRRVYERAGVAEYWFVDLDALRVERYALAAEGRYGPPELASEGIVRSAALPGFEVEVAEVLAPAGFAGAGPPPGSE